MGFKTEMIYLFRIVISFLLGFAVGLERKMRFKEAGIRTHSIVSVGACLIMLVSKYGFSDIPSYDASRVAAQIVSGIGFLGAGMILYKREGLHGLTTAAGIWTTAGIGMCVGSGLYYLAVGATVVIIIIQCAMHLPFRIFKTKRLYVFKVRFVCNGDENAVVKQIFNVKRFEKINFNNEQTNILATAFIRSADFINDEDIKDIVQHNDFITSVERVEE